MKFSIAFVVVIVAALVAPGHQANLPADSPLTSTLTNALVIALELVNKALNSVETSSNNYFLEKLQNYTQIKEWSVNIQNHVTTEATEIIFFAINAYKTYVEASSPTNVETKVLDCISNQKSNILTVVQNATTLNGWCNNRMAANLTIAFQKNTATALSLNAQFNSFTKSLKSCKLGDQLCLIQYATSVFKVVSNEASGESGTLVAGLKDVYAIYKIMFGQDVPACGKKYFIPILLEGLRKSVNEVASCVF